MFFPRRPQPDTAPTFPCRCCGREIRIYDEHPRPWCPHCGESLAPPREGPTEPPAPAPAAASAPPRDDAYHPWAVTTLREPAPAPPAAPEEEAPPGNAAPPSAAAAAEPPPAAPAVAPTRRRTCAACGCAYQFARSIKRLPCPACGLAGPVEAFRCRFWGHLACAAVGVLALVVAEHTMLSRSWRAAAEVGGPALGAVAVMHLLLVVSGLRRDRYEDREVAQRAIDAGTASVLTPCALPDVVDPTRPTKLHWLALVGVCLAGCGLFAPAGYQHLRGWPSNEGVEPEAVGPGDEVTVAFPDHGIVAGRDPWAGQATAEATGPALPASGDVLAARPGALGANEPLTVRCVLPARAELAGTDVQLRLRLSVTHPERAARNGPSKPKMFEKSVRLTLAEVGCAAALERAWVAGWLAATLTYLVSVGALLALTLAGRPAGAAGPGGRSPGGVVGVQ